MNLAFRFLSFMPAIFAGAMLSGALRFWGGRWGLDGAPWALQAGMMVPIAVAFAGLLRNVKPGGASRRVLAVGDLVSVVALGAALEYPTASALAVGAAGWAIYRLDARDSRWGAVLLALASCRWAAELSGSSWVEVGVSAVAAVFLWRKKLSDLRLPPRLVFPEPLVAASHGAIIALVALAAVHVLQVVSPVARAAEAGLLLAVAASRWVCEKLDLRLAPPGRVILLVVAWVATPGLLDRNLYPLLSSSPLWPLGWLIVLLPWSASLAPVSGVGAWGWLGAWVVAWVAHFAPGLVTEPSFLALACASLACVGPFLAWVIERSRVALGLREAAAVLGLLIVGATSAERLSAGPEERVLDGVERVGHSAAVVRSYLGGEMQLRERFHSRSVSSESAKELKRQGLLPFRLHEGAPLKRLVVLGATNPFAVSAALEQPGLARIDWVSRDPVGFELGKWWISEQAAGNNRAESARVISSPSTYLRDVVHGSDYWDAICLSPAAPWSDEGTALLARDLPALVRERLYSDGIAVQWVQIHHWSEETLFELVRRWQDAFGVTAVELWRADLSPYSPSLAIVARMTPAASAQAQAGATPISDRFLGSLAASFSLKLADPRGLADLMPRTPATPRPRIENAWLVSRNRFRAGGTLDAQWLVQRLMAQATRMAGPSEGGLRYTRAAILKLTGQPDWERERGKAVELLGFDPSRDLYREIFPDSPPPASGAAR